MSSVGFIAIVGAGPQLGLAIARTFGSQGFDVALISRNRDKLDGLVTTLTAEGITAAAFPADVLDRHGLTQALKEAATRFGGIDVLEYSPAETEPPYVRRQIALRLHGAVTATEAVLPAMREAGAGTLLFTTDARSRALQPPITDINAAMTDLRAWAVDLHEQLAGTGVQAAHIGIDATIGTPTFYGQPRATADQISPVHWELHTTHRDQAERIFRA
ncbi:SDR family NAD(P)-dependent oxidoreductase [Streptomyces lincolnensis]|nr:SDR family NAD(P)-dependent oxidoreductase [Streptomyces lincolnensis]